MAGYFNVILHYIDKDEHESIANLCHKEGKS
jgi:hypothetical protein